MAPMPVPEAAVDEHRPLARAVGGVGRARKIAVSDPKAMTERVERTAGDLLEHIFSRFCVGK